MEDILEMDIHSTSDSVLILLHDHKVNRTSNGFGYVWNYSFEELRHLNAGYFWTNDDSLTFPFRKFEIKIPSLDEIFESLKKNVIDRNPQYSAEVIFIDDGSTDQSFQILMNLYETYPELIIIVKLTRNFGTYPAIIAGYEKATGKCVINLSADLQDPPELIHDMLDYHFTKKYNN